jgi:hypothetical protein
MQGYHTRLLAISELAEGFIELPVGTGGVVATVPMLAQAAPQGLCNTASYNRNANVYTLPNGQLVHCVVAVTALFTELCFNAHITNISFFRDTSTKKILYRKQRVSIATNPLKLLDF